MIEASDVRVLLDRLATSRTLGDHKVILKRHLKVGNRLSASSFLRVIEGDGFIGQISAELVNNEVADEHELRSSEDAFFDWRLIDGQAQFGIYGPDGATLLITSAAWTGSTLQGGLTFLTVALEHLVRWFEGNDIRSILFRFNKQCEPLLGPVLSAVSAENLRLTLGANDVATARVLGPWSATGVTVDWGQRLLGPHLNPSVFLPQEYKLLGRIFHEYEFNIDEAVRSTLPNWTLSTTGNRSHGSASANKWRTDVARILGINKTSSQGVPSMAIIQRLFEDYPRILTWQHLAADIEPAHGS